MSFGVLIHLPLVRRHPLGRLLAPHLLLRAAQLLPLHRDERAKRRVVHPGPLLRQLLPRLLAAMKNI